MEHEESVYDKAPPEAHPTAWSSLRHVLAPIERIMALESAAGYLLLVVTLAALAWVNIHRESYEAVWHAEFGFEAFGVRFVHSLHFWINEGAMSVFFLHAGLEIKRQIVEGELSTVRRAMLPAVAAAGGMIAPALIFLALNSGAHARGFAVPAATDIAFAIGAIAVLGRRASPALKILLLTLAVVDDIGAILIIAVFYSSGVSWIGLAIAAAAGIAFWALRVIGKRPGWIYYAPLLVMWGGLLEAGIHPTLAGVAIGLMVPTKAWIPRHEFVRRVRAYLADIGGLAAVGNKEAADAQEKRATGAIFSLRHAAAESLSPLARIEHAIHPIVVFAIMPLFALANAGVYLGGDTLAHLDMRVGAGIALGLFMGKPLGVMAASWTFSKLGWCRVPDGVSWTGVLVVGLLAGIGFTMSNFTALLAFDDPSIIGTAKLAILIGSGLSIVVGLSVGSRLLAVKREGREAVDLVEAESSDAV